MPGQPAPTTTAKEGGNQTGTLTDPYRAYNFKLNIKGVNEGHFTECTGLAARVQSISYREGGAGPAVRRLPGRVDYSEVTLRYGLTTSAEMWQWFQSAIKGQVDRRDISIIMLGENGEEALRWNLTRAWVAEWQGAPLDALGNEAAVESMKIVFEGLERA